MALGEDIVERLKIKDDYDPLGAWMAHYLAEKLTAYKKSRGAAREKIEPALFEMILGFWKHRAFFPRGKEPFQNYEAVLRTLESLDPSRETGRYFDYAFRNRDKSQEPTETESWLRIASALDQATRSLIRFAIANAAMSAGEPEATWLEAAGVLGADIDTDIPIIRIIYETDKQLAETPPDHNAIERAKLEQLLKNLEFLMVSSESVSASLNERLKMLPPPAKDSTTSAKVNRTAPKK